MLIKTLCVLRASAVRKRTMHNKVLDEIKVLAHKKLKQAYGYCGTVDLGAKATLSCDDKEGGDIKIYIGLMKDPSTGSG